MVALTVLVCLLPVSSALAEEDEESDVFQLGTVIFSVDVQGDKLNTSEKMETSVTRTDIERFEDKDIGEALSRMPGVRFVGSIGRRAHHNTQNFRYDSGVVVRGFEAFGNTGVSVPLFIDGIPVYVPYDYSMDMGRFSTSGVSTISVSKGYSSVLYGPNAIGGVINVVSQRPVKPLFGSFTLGAGSGDVTEFSGIFGTLQDKWYAQAGWSYLNTEFIHAAEPFIGADAALQQKDTDRWNYGTRDKKMEFKFGYIPNATDEYVVSYLNQTGVKGPKRDALNCSDANPECWAAGYMNTFWEWPSWDRETISFVSTTNFGNIYIKPRVFYDKYDNALFNWGGNYAARPNQTSMYDDYAWGGSLETGLSMTENNTLKGKFDYKFNQHLNIDVDGFDGARVGDEIKLEEQVFFFAIEDTHRFNEHWEVQGGLLYSRRQTTYIGDGLNVGKLNEAFTSANFDMKPSDIDSWDPQAVLFYNPNRDHSFHYSISRKTRFPSMSVQYIGGGSDIIVNTDCPFNDETERNECLRVLLPNPDMKPEKALHHEIGWNGRFFSRLDINLDWFYSLNNDMISLSSEDVTAYTGFAVVQAVNVAGDIRRQGFDLGVEYNATDRILVGTSFSYLHSVNKDDAEWRPRTQPAYHGSLYANIGLNDWVALIPTLDYSGRSRVNSTPTRNAAGVITADNRWDYHKGFALVDLKLSITPPMHRNISINVGAENLFNKDYRGWGNSPANNYLEIYPTPGRYIYANLRYRL